MDTGRPDRHEQRLVRAVIDTALTHPALPEHRVESLARELETFHVITYREAIEWLGRQWGDDLTAADEARLTERFGIVSVARYPREIEFFNMLDTREDGGQTVECCDLLLPFAGETFGSSVRECYGLGFDRLIQYLWGVQDVTAVIPFPVDARYGSRQYALVP